MGVLAYAPSPLWYLTRATGAVTLLLLTVSLVIGIANVGRLALPGWPRFVVEGIHRNVSLLAIAVLAVHIITTILDPFGGINVFNAIIPFTGSYRPLWLGLGAFASDLLIAIAITSVVRRRLGHGAWRATHWLAYVCWPVAVLHAVGTGSDVKQVWLLALTAICVIAVVGAVWVRVGFGWPAQRSLRGTAVAASIALPAAFLVWLPSGPLASNWARRAGTPASLLPKHTTAGTTTPGSSTGPVGAFTASVAGTVTQTAAAGGGARVDIALTATSGPLPEIHVDIIGQESAGGGVTMTASGVTLGGAANPQRFSGHITQLAGTDIAATVSSGKQQLRVVLTLRIESQSGATTGTLQVAPG